MPSGEVPILLQGASRGLPALSDSCSQMIRLNHWDIFPVARLAHQGPHIPPHWPTSSWHSSGQFSLSARTGSRQPWRRQPLRRLQGLGSRHLGAELQDSTRWQRSSPTQDQPHQAWDPSRFGGAFSDNTFHSLTGVPIPPPLPDLLSGNVMNLQAGAAHSAGRVAGDKAVDDMTKVIYICTNAL